MEHKVYLVTHSWKLEGKEKLEKLLKGVNKVVIEEFLFPIPDISKEDVDKELVEISLGKKTFKKSRLRKWLKKEEKRVQDLIKKVKQADPIRKKFLVNLAKRDLADISYFRDLVRFFEGKGITVTQEPAPVWEVFEKYDIVRNPESLFKTALERDKILIDYLSKEKEPVLVIRGSLHYPILKELGDKKGIKMSFHYGGKPFTLEKGTPFVVDPELGVFWKKVKKLLPEDYDYRDPLRIGAQVLPYTIIDQYLWLKNYPRTAGLVLRFLAMHPRGNNPRWVKKFLEEVRKGLELTK